VQSIEDKPRDKLSICTHTSKGEKPASLAREFGLGKSTVTDNLKSSEKLTSFKGVLVSDASNNWRNITSCKNC